MSGRNLQHESGIATWETKFKGNVSCDKLFKKAKHEKMILCFAEVTQFSSWIFPFLPKPECSKVLH